MKKSITAPENCTGCSLCANLCPKEAISMEWNDDGFLVPSVNHDACVDCGICVKQCPALRTHEGKDRSAGTSRSTGYAAWSTDEQIVRESSSGGVFSEIARYIIRQGGCVYGVRWEENQHARFHRIEREEEIAQFRGSKYVQAEPGMVYKQVLHDLKTGRKVLFAGTPCQVHALNVYLKKEYSNLLTISLACHGVPSRLLAERYVFEKEQKERAKMTGWQFRNKLNGWVEFLIVNEFENGASSKTIKHKDDYMRVFLGDLAMKKSCFSCVHSYVNNAVPEIGDIALGDFWNVRAYHPEWSIFNGISAVLCHSEKGKEIIASLKQENKLILHEEEYETAHHPTKAPLGYNSKKLNLLMKAREKALVMLRRQAPVQKVLKLTERKVSIFGIRISEMNPILRWGVRMVKTLLSPAKPRVGILTEPLYSNYGGALQAYAMQNVVTSLGFEPYTIQYSVQTSSLFGYMMTKIRNSVAALLWRLHILPASPVPRLVQGVGCSAFLKKYIRRTRLSSAANVKSSARRYSFAKLIVGSDQVWNATAKPLPMPFYYLEWAGDDLRRRSIAYAASFGKDTLDYSQEVLQRCSGLLKEFKAVSTREISGIAICESMGCESVQMPDPTLLLPFERYDDIISETKTSAISYDSVAVYVLDQSKEKEELVCRVADAMGAPVTEMNISDSGEYSCPVSVAQWLRTVRDSKCLITDSFHGCVFAIIFNKPFVCLGNEGRGNARFDTLLGTFGLEDRMITDATPEKILKVLNIPIDWYRVNEIHESERERGINFLKENLF